jgi:mannosyltransferase
MDGGSFSKTKNFMKRSVVLVAALTGAAAVIRFATLGEQSYWYDETVTVSLMHRSLAGMLRALPTSETAPPLYYLVAWPWSRIFGFSEFSLRALSAVAGTATVPVVYGCGCTFVSRRVGFVAAALAVSSPLLVWYSQEARAYSLLVLLSALSFFFFARAWAEPSRTSLVWWAVCSALAIATYYFAALLVLAECAGLILHHGRRRAIWYAAIAPAAATILLLPLAAFQAHRGNASWIGSLPLSLRVEEAIRQLATPTPAPLWAGAGSFEYVTRSRWLLALALLAIALAALILLGERHERRRGLIALAFATTVLAGPLIVSVLGRLIFNGSDTFLYRGLLPAWVPLTVFIGAGLATRRSGMIGALAAVALVAVSMSVVIDINKDDTLQRDDWRALAAASNTTCNSIILVSPGYEAHALLHYRRDLRPISQKKVLADEILVLRRSTRPLKPHLPGFELTTRRTIQYWSLEGFAARHLVHVSPAELADELTGGDATALRPTQSRCGHL